MKAAIQQGMALAVSASDTAETCRRMSEARWLRDALRAAAYWHAHGVPKPIAATPNESLLRSIFG